MRSAKSDADKMICIFSFPPLKFLRNIPWEIFGCEILSTYNLRDHIPEMKTKKNLEKDISLRGGGNVHPNAKIGVHARRNLSPLNL